MSRSDDRIAVPGVTCWRRDGAGRVAFLVDGERCFRAIGDSLLRAERSVLITGWDLHSEVELWRGRPPSPVPPTLGELLVHLVRTRRRLHVYVLVWDFAALYVAERELFPIFRRWWRMPRRLRFRYDAAHPTGASHHQKIVVVDDAVAFSGGLDLTARRWDTREHRPGHPQRIDPWGHPYPPFHDVQMLVDGAAARALGDLVRERWRRATGRRLRAPAPGADRWPAGVTPDLEGTEVAIARTLPAWEGAAEVREIERLYVRALEAARRVVYIENQYLTSHVIGDALARSLTAPTGPEIVYVGPARCSGWLEERTMGAVRSRLLGRLEEADRHGRLHTYAPRAPDAQSTPVNVHSKVMVVDDRYVQIGSANLNNRSMGLDSECDLAVEAAAGSAQAAAIEAFCDGLVAEHLHVAREAVAAARRQAGSLGAAIEHLRDGHDGLERLQPRSETALEGWVPDVNPLDPERPLAAEELVGAFLPEAELERADWPVVRVVVVAVVLIVLWRVVATGGTDPERLTRFAAGLAAQPGGAVAGTLIVAVASTLMVPFVPLVVASGMIFGPWTGFVVALGGGVASAALGHAAGKHLWRETVRRLAGRRVNRLSSVLVRGGVPAVVVLRVVPVAPFGVVNVVAGSVGVRARDFVLGTGLGLAPGVLGLTVLGDGALEAMRRPSWETIAMFAVIAVVVGFGIVRGQRFVTRRLGASTPEG